MSFLTAIPEELLAAAAQLEGIGNSLTAQNAGAAAPTTAIAPAAADPVSALQATIFGTYGSMYQQLAAEAQSIQQQFVSTLGLSSGTYTQTESANVAATTPVDLINQLSTFLGGPGNSVGGNPFGLSSNAANFLSFEGGNWASAMSDCLGMAGGGLLPAASADAADAGDAAGAAAGAADAVNVTAPAGGMGGMAAMPVGGLGQATMVGKLSVPPSWAGTFTPGVSPATAVQTVGWTGAAPQAGPGTIVPGMPGLGAAARNSAGFGAPRYGVKPIVMPKIRAV
ncbi:PE family protein [Mycobacterium paraense]|uniref:PE family protein n=1 Tax=Mycobacterium paraense TaxID=767916 RepID=A0ABX3VR99_9MYCO|nr:PE domain-containing protein [Mycobacterium paraense]MCV7443657.1 PE domain-containing protein [Mycobacterium paraense]ORW31941.1 PE family protein [Mycobacterium paraense]ORW39469.1 PE family protein [Mycobacterium paraense]ORW47421.1 PE family protein [Mycobacterium paraense]